MIVSDNGTEPASHAVLAWTQDSGAGPKFYKFGNRVRYLRADVEAWAAERRDNSTSGEIHSARRTA